MNTTTWQNDQRGSRTDSDLLTLQRTIYRRALRTQAPVDALFGSFLDRRNLEAAWTRVASSDGAGTPGIDGVTCHELQHRTERWLERIHQDLRTDSYRPKEPRWIDIAKSEGKMGTRRLGILTIQDRVVHAATKQILEPVLEHRFLPGSFGFRPGRSVASAVLAATDAMKNNARRHGEYCFAAHLDVRDCFGSLDHSLIQSATRKFVSDEDLLRLIDRLIACGSQIQGSWFGRRRVGIVQGSGLSPLLCNLCLHQLDLDMTSSDAPSRDCLMFRYADDLFLAGPSKASVARRLAFAIRQAGRLKLTLGCQEGIRPLSEGVTWLGVRIQSRRQSADKPFHYGHQVPESRVPRIMEKISEMTRLPSDRIARDAFNLSRWIVSLNEQLKQWWAGYRYADNATDVFRQIDDHARSCVRELLHELTRVPWSALKSQFWRRLPRGFWTWEIEGTRLTCLSSLAPHCPDRLIRRPAWERNPPTSDRAH